MKKIIAIEISEHQSSLEGSLYGLQQPSIVASVTIRKVSESLEHRIISLVDELLEMQRGLEDQSNFKFIQKVYLWISRIHKINKIPLSKIHRIYSRSHTVDSEIYRIALPTTHPEASRIVVRWLNFVINALCDITKIDENIIKIIKSKEELKIALIPFAPKGLNSFQILEAVYRLNIPIQKITQGIYMLGIGEHSRWIDSTMTDRTPFLGVRAAEHKHETAKILKNAGLPGGENRVVNTAEQAVETARSFGFPVVVKPADKEQGIGVMADLCDETIVRSAYEAASKVSNKILVERHVHGFTHRLTVVHDRVIRVSKRIAGGIVGDGIHEIGELVAKLQQDPEYQRRAQSIGKQLISLDDEAMSLIRQYGLNPSHVLAPGEYLKLRRRDNVNAGARSQNCELSRVHPDNIQLAIDAAQALRLDIAGIDLIIENIEQSWRNVDALICEVNAKPQIVAPEDPLFYDGILTTIMGGKFRIPLHLVIIPASLELRNWLIQKWKAHASSNAISDTTGVWVNGHSTTCSFDNGYKAALAMFARTSVREAVCLMTLTDIKQTGLPTNYWTSVYVEQKELFDANELTIMNSVLSLLAPGTSVRLLHDQRMG